MAEVGGRLQNGQLEASYERSSDTAQVPMDLAVSAIGVMYATVLARKALEIEGPKTAMVHAILTAAYFLLPLILIWRDRRSYAAIRQKFLMTWLPSLWYFACRAGEVLNHVPSDSSRGLLLMLLLRSQVVMLFWWALQAAPQLTEPCRLVVAWLRRATLASGLRKLPLAEPVGDCVLLLTFLQLTLGYVLPSLITLRLERNSRRRLLASQQGWRPPLPQQQQQQGLVAQEGSQQRQQQHGLVAQEGTQQQQQQRQRWRQGFRAPGILTQSRRQHDHVNLSSIWLPWQPALVILACWHLTEGAVRWFPQLLKKE
ncbi:hypothetical protein N2152v2_006772 [Parachlorella kessleri]